MIYRVEDKYLINEQTMLILEKKISQLLQADSFSRNSSYTISSVYFDDFFDSGYYDTLSGTDYRKKYRIRIYNESFDTIKLEIKNKVHGKTNKQTCLISVEQMGSLLHGKAIPTNSPVINEFCSAINIKGLRPKCIVSYERNAYTSQSGNVRITFDRNIRTTNRIELFGCNSPSFFPVRGETGLLSSVLEIKYDSFLPNYLGFLFNGCDMQQISYSKYALSREVLEGCQ